MALNEIVKYKLGYIGTNNGAILCGTNDLAALNVGAVTGLCTDISGNVFASDSVNHVILKVDPRGKARVWAGKAGTWGNNGSLTVAGTDARFNNPGGIACDLTGNVYVADVGNNQIRKIDTNAKVSLLAGDPKCTAGYVNGACWSAKFSSPHDVTVVSGGQVYVADTNNNTVRQIDGSLVRTVVGDGTAGDGVGPATSARLRAPYAVGSDFSGKVYISDTGNVKVKVYDLMGNLSTRFSGTGATGFHLGNFNVASFQILKFMDVDRTGNIYIVSFDDDLWTRILRIDSNGNVQLVKQYTMPDSAYVRSVAVDRSQFLYVAESGKPEFESSSSSLNSSSSSLNSSSSTSTPSSASTTSVSSSESSPSSINSSSSFSRSISSASSESSSSSSFSRSVSSVSTASSSKSSVSSVSTASSSKSSASSASSVSSVSTSMGISSSSSGNIPLLIHDGEEVTLPAPEGHYDVTFDGPINTFAVIVIGGVPVVVGDVGGFFVWDIGGAQEHTFTTIGESINVHYGVYDITVIWDGTGSQLFQMRVSVNSSWSSSSESSANSSSSSKSSVSSKSSASTPSSASSKSSVSSVSSASSSKSSVSSASTPSSASSSKSSVSSASSLSSVSTPSSASSSKSSLSSANSSSSSLSSQTWVNQINSVFASGAEGWYSVAAPDLTYQSGDGNPAGSYGTAAGGSSSGNTAYYDIAVPHNMQFRVVFDYKGVGGGQSTTKNINWYTVTTTVDITVDSAWHTYTSPTMTNTSGDDTVHSFGIGTFLSSFSSYEMIDNVKIQFYM